MLPNAGGAPWWWSERRGARAVRALLAPLGWAWRGGAALRNACYDAGILPARATAIPALSVGNLGVGGTGKTPLASWFATALRARGARPAIVLRGYGEDEPLVHAVLAPGVDVIVDRDRVLGARLAGARGCDVVVFDDAFQHRRARRLVDVVVVSADQPWSTRCLPAGPLRESIGGVRRADLVVVTRKAASPAAAGDVEERLRSLGAPHVARALLALDALVPVEDGPGAAQPLAALQGRTVLAVAGVGNPGAFFAQVERAGGRVTCEAKPDHHAYDASDVAALLARAAGMDLVVCTLKDAVKLRGHWPRSAPPLWYVSQRVDLEGGRDLVEAALRRLLDARSSAIP